MSLGGSSFLSIRTMVNLALGWVGERWRDQADVLNLLPLQRPNRQQ